MQALRRLYAKLRLRVNEAKSAVARPWGRKFLGYRFWVAKGGEVRRRVARQALEAMKDRVRVITGRNRGRSLEQVSQDLRGYLVGWREYYRLADTPSVFGDLDKWVRHRLRVVQAVETWTDRVSGTAGSRPVATRSRLCGPPHAPLVVERQQVPSRRAADTLLRRAGSPATCDLTSTFRTAGCGPACPVVWEGSGGDNPPPPIPIGVRQTPRSIARDEPVASESMRGNRTRGAQSDATWTRPQPDIITGSNS